MSQQCSQMNAWIITWESTSKKKVGKDPLVAIFSSRKSKRWIKEYIENICIFKFYQPSEWVYYANRRTHFPDKAIEYQIPNGNGGFSCGSNPFLSARIVSEIKIESNENDNFEIISWREPPIYKWKDKNNDIPVIAKNGIIRTIKREIRNPYIN